MNYAILQKETHMTDRIYYSKSAEQRAQQQRLMFACIFAAAGITAGIVIALLFAPQSGEQTRQDVASNAEKAIGTGRDTTSRMVETLQKDVDRLRHQVEERIKNA